MSSLMKFFCFQSKAPTPAVQKTNDKLSLATWNIAAINNNPFEYWITYDEDPAYTKLMSDFEAFIETPGDKDVTLGSIFTQDMFDDLKNQMKELGWESLDTVEVHWHRYYKDRKIITQFLKDPTIGNKRLTSMPDRFTNTINAANGQVYRPTVINMYEGSLDSVDTWFNEWKRYMFGANLTFSVNGSQVTKKVCQLLQPIKKSKYPAITEEEEKISIPLQTVLLAAFDAVLVHMMNTVAPKKWTEIKAAICAKLNKQKTALTLDILSKTYGDTDIIFLQEAAATFIEQIKKSSLGQKYHVLFPKKLDALRDQNSMILLSRALFPSNESVEVTDTILAQLPQGKVPVSNGDLFGVTCSDRQGQGYFLTSFHGDTNGLATLPIVNAVHQTAQTKFQAHTFFFGLDANTYENGNDKFQSVQGFIADFLNKGMTSCFGDNPPPNNYTTFNARTYIQPQLNKACKSTDKKKKADINPKDFILFYKSQYSSGMAWKDNTGEKEYKENIVFPTMKFPSDHGIVGATVQKVSSPLSPPSTPTKEVQPAQQQKQAPKPTDCCKPKAQAPVTTPKA